MWEVFGAQCDRKLNRNSKKTVGVISNPNEGCFKTKDTIEECCIRTGTHRKTIHTRSVLYGYTKVLHFRQGLTGLVMCYNSSATDPLLHLPFDLCPEKDNSHLGPGRSGVSGDTATHTEEEIHQPKPSFTHVNQSIINITPLVLDHKKMLTLKYIPCEFVY